MASSKDSKSEGRFLRKPKGKISARSQDFSGQDTGAPASSPASEVAGNRDGGTAGVNSRSVPGERRGTVRVFRSDNPKLHSDASYGTVDGTDDRLDGTPPRGYGTSPGSY